MIKFERQGNATLRSIRNVVCLTGIFAICTATMAALPTAVDAVAIHRITPLTAQDCAAMQAANVITDDNQLPCRRLVRVRFAYVDFEGQHQPDGELIVMDALAPHVQHLMAQLLAAEFPLHSARPLTYYAGDDDASMADNNSSAFNGRRMTGGGNWSKHAYGAAIDVNPLQNPYIKRAPDGSMLVQPPAAALRFTDRHQTSPGMAERVRDLFAENGFLIWGGNWRQPIDYQHFEIGDRQFIEKLANSTPHQASVTYDNYVAAYRKCIARKPKNAERKNACARQTVQNGQ